MCNNCGYPLQGNEQMCPECGNIIEQPQPVYEPQPQQVAAQPQPQSFAGNMPGAQSSAPMPVYVVATPPKTDWANYIYECSVIAWRTATTNFARCQGRASRREFWSFLFFFWFLAWPIATYFLGLLAVHFHEIDATEEWIIFTFCLLVVALIPTICVTIRRFHDINRSGWWSLLPYVGFLMCLKKSDEGPNEYGYPEPASDILND